MPIPPRCAPLEEETGRVDGTALRHLPLRRVPAHDGRDLRGAHPRAQHPVGLHGALQRRGGGLLRDRRLHHRHRDLRCLRAALGRLRPAGGGGHGRRDDCERDHRLGRGPDLHSAPRRLPRDRTLGIAEIFRLVLKNEVWATNGPRGISLIPKPFEHLPQPWNQVGMLLLVFAGGRRALRPARTGAAFPLGTGDGRDPRKTRRRRARRKGRRAPAH